MSKPMVSACVFAAKSLEDLWVKIGECVWFIPKFRLSPSRSLLGNAVAIPDGWWISDTFWFQMMEQLWNGWPYQKKQCFDHGIHYHCQHRWMRMCCPNDERDTPMTKFCGYPVKLADPSFFSSAFLKMKQLHIWATVKTPAILNMYSTDIGYGNWWKLLKTRGKRWDLPKLAIPLFIPFQGYVIIFL